MKTILVVFMTQYLQFNDESAKAYNHYFVAAAYFFPVIGAMISDWLFGKYRTILALSIRLLPGTPGSLLLMKRKVGLAAGLCLIAVGAGGIKPCVSAHVGDQFGQGNKHLLSRVFGWFYFSINVGAFASSLLTPILLRRLRTERCIRCTGRADGIGDLRLLAGAAPFYSCPAHRLQKLPHITRRRGCSQPSAPDTPVSLHQPVLERL